MDGKIITKNNNMTEQEYNKQRNELIKNSTQKEILFNIGSMLAQLLQIIKENQNDKKDENQQNEL